MSWKERSYYRIRYPRRERPWLVIGGSNFEVLDCSETGLRYQYLGDAPPEPGAVVTGTLRIPREEEELPIEGTVVWVRDREVALHLPETRIPLGMILREQRYLRAHYPAWPTSWED